LNTDPETLQTRKLSKTYNKEETTACFASKWGIKNPNLERGVRMRTVHTGI
jgi:hypothetical protein